MNPLKSYYKFVARPVFWLQHIVVPFISILLTVAFQYDWIPGLRHFPGFVILMLTPICFMISEVVFDIFSFCGLLRKGACDFELFKTSAKGEAYLKAALIWDGVRRLFTFVLLFFINGWITMGDSIGAEDFGDDLEYLLLHAGICLICMGFGILTSRCMKSSMVALAFIYIVSMLNTILTMVFSIIPGQVVMIPLLWMVGIVLSLLPEYLGVKRYERSFCDE